MEKKYLFVLVFLLLLITGLVIFNLYGFKQVFQTTTSEFLCPVPKEYCKQGKVIKFKV